MQPKNQPHPDGGAFAPAADRNKGPILSVLRKVLPGRGLVLEIASGTGLHVAHFARHLTGLAWQPSDPDPASRRSIGAWTRGIANVREPLELDVHRTPWPVERADAVLCINMIHIAPWSATESLLQGADNILANGGPLVLYGPFRRGGRHTAPSNEAFDIDLRRRNAEWGVRDLETVAGLAAKHGFALAGVHEMPANNLTVVFRKADTTPASGGP